MVKPHVTVPEKQQDDEHKPLTVRELLAKARAMTSDVEESAAIDAISAEEQTWRSMQAVLAPYDPESLLRYIEITPHLRPCIDAMAHNIDGFGFTSGPVEPWIDSTDDEKALQAVKDAMAIEAWVTEEEEARAAEAEAEKLSERIAELTRKSATPRTLRKWQRRLDLIKEKPPASDIDDEEIDNTAEAELKRIRDQYKRERYLFDAWFKHCCSESSFVDLRKKVRADAESHGWGTVEWLRDATGRLKRLQYVPAYTVRPLKDRGESIAVVEDDSITPLSKNRETVVSRRFWLYVQQVDGRKVYFKSPGDPRIVSRTTGKIYETVEDLQRPTDAKKPGEGKEAVEANELMWLGKHDPKTPCSPPDWIGNLLSVLGGREADETNYFYLRDNAIPSGLLFCHGGTVPRVTKARIEHRMAHELKGAQGSGKIMVVEAKPGKGAAPGEKSMLPSLTFQSLRDAHTDDALFSKYDLRGGDRIGASFRLSPILRGYTPSDLNRATAIAALYFAEQQVFSPLRNSFDWNMTKYILPEIGVRLLVFKSLSPPTTSPGEVGDFVRATAPHGAFTPAELRDIAGETMNRKMIQIDEEWTKRPLLLTLNGQGGGGEAATTADNAEIAARLRGIEIKVAQIVTEELRAVGLDYEVGAGFVDNSEGDLVGEDDNIG
jgi:capsid portal protein